jgi:predicted 3-demethylubiquinone-9 3-methyltransferase (glyoxalase superfamily)
MTQTGFTTCLWFDGQAEEAAAYYTSIFKNSERGAVVRVPDSGPGEPGAVLVAEFTVNGQKFVGLNGGPEFTFSEAISFQIRCEDQAEVDHYWAKLTENGGEESQCGWLKDRFGVSWQVVPQELLDMIGSAEREKAARAFQAMMPMKKLDIATLRAAYDGA